MFARMSIVCGVALSVAAVAATAACGAPAASAPPPPPAPKFDTITVDVTGGGNPAVITYDLDNGSDQTHSRTSQMSQTTPMHLVVGRPHGDHDIMVDAFTFAFQSSPPFNCVVSINGEVVAAASEQEPCGGAKCSFKGHVG